MAPVKVVGLVTWKHVHVKVPDVLISCGLVVLSDRCALASICRANARRNALRKLPHCVPVLRRESIDVLNVCARNHEDGTRVPWPPLRRDACERTLCHRDDIGRLVSLIEDALLKSTEGARVSIRFMSNGEHARLSHAA